MPKYTTMLNKVMLSTESRMRGNMQVRFGGRYGKTYRRKAARRPVPSLRLGKGGNLLALAAELHPSSDISGLLRQIAERNPPCVRYPYLPGNRLRKNPLSATWRHFRLPHTPCLPICRNGVSVRKPPGGNAGKSVTSAGANGIMPSAFRTLPAVLSFVAATSKVVYPQNQFR